MSDAHGKDGVFHFLEAEQVMWWNPLSGDDNDDQCNVRLHDTVL